MTPVERTNPLSEIIAQAGFHVYANLRSLANKVADFVQNVFGSIGDLPSSSDTMHYCSGKTSLYDGHPVYLTNPTPGKYFQAEATRVNTEATNKLKREEHLCATQMSKEKENTPLSFNYFNSLKQRMQISEEHPICILQSPLSKVDYEFQRENLQSQLNETSKKKRDAGNQKDDDEYARLKGECEKIIQEITLLDSTHLDFEIIRESVKLSGLEYTVADTVGRRKTKNSPKSEDAHFNCEFTIRVGRTNHQCQAFGVFDGHSSDGQSGSKVSQFLAENFPKTLEANLKSTSDLNDATITDVINKTFQELNELCKEIPESHKNGSTATIALVIGTRTFVANAGDSRAVLVKSDGTVKRLTYDAKPTESRFTQHVSPNLFFNGKLKKSDGESIGVIRSFGDFSSEGLVQAIPEITSCEIQDGDTLLIACDGFWDQVSSQNTTIIAKMKNLDEIPTLLVASALDREPLGKSNDNITVMAIRRTRGTPPHTESPIQERILLPDLNGVNYPSTVLEIQKAELRADEAGKRIADLNAILGVRNGNFSDLETNDTSSDDEGWTFAPRSQNQISSISQKKNNIQKYAQELNEGKHPLLSEEKHFLDRYQAHFPVKQR